MMAWLLSGQVLFCCGEPLHTRLTEIQMCRNCLRMSGCCRVAFGWEKFVHFVAYPLALLLSQHYLLTPSFFTPNLVDISPFVTSCDAMFGE